MKKLLLATGLTALMGTTAAAQEIGATFSRFDDNWLTVLRTGMVEYAGTIDGLSYQQEDASDDLAKQIDQVRNFVASGVDAIHCQHRGHICRCSGLCCRWGYATGLCETVSLTTWMFCLRPKRSSASNENRIWHIVRI
jgi:hypothetical protein